MWTVYMHTCPNGKRYAGMTSQKPYKRWEYGHGYETQKLFHADIQKYGWKNIKHEIVAEFENVEAAADMETELIGRYNTTDERFGYNISACTRVSDSGFPSPMHSDATRKKISEAAKARDMSTRNLSGLKEHQYIQVKGKPHNVSPEGRLSHHGSCSKIVVQYNSDMLPVRVYSAASVACRVVGFSVYNPLRNGYKGRGCIWKYFDALDADEQRRVENIIHEIHTINGNNDIIVRRWNHHDEA